jgi:methylated-DNA-protein-cysteine methyltransferase related protein
MRVTGHRPQGAFAAIWRVVAGIPRGRVATYGQVARMAGFPGAARTVGWALGALPDDPARGARAVPWHRVINAAGRVSARGPGDAACRRQIVRLRREGIRPGADGAIDLERYGWDGRAAPIRPAAPGALRRSPGARPNWSSHRRA